MLDCRLRGRWGRQAVFISHALRDNEMAPAVERALEERGVEAWIDLSESESARRSIVSCRTTSAAVAVVLLWSEAAAGSRWSTPNG